MKNKKSRIQILRHAIQLAAFIILPGLFVEAFSGVIAIVKTIFNGSALDITQLFPALLLIIAALLLGRFFCGWLCAFGSMGDLLYTFGRKVLNIKFKMPEKADRYLKYLKYVMLVILAVISIMGITIEGFSPWDAFGTLASWPPAISYAFSKLLPGTLILIAIMLASLFVERFFCRYLCPLGAVFSAASEFKLVKIKKPCADCGTCKACTSVCAMGIQLSGENEISSGECIGCMKCTVPCPRENVRLAAFSRGMAQLFAAYASVFIIGLYYAGDIGLDSLKSNTKIEYYVSTPAQTSTGTTTSTQSPSVTQSSSSGTAKTATSSSTYTDGTYKGSGTGFHNKTTTVSVTVSNGKITAINTISNGDTPQYYSRAFSTIVSSIISKQSTSVDTVSGATFTSRGIISAVSSALSQAKN